MFRLAAVVFAKELRDALRDRRTLLARTGSSDFESCFVQLAFGPQAAGPGDAGAADAASLAGGT